MADGTHPVTVPANAALAAAKSALRRLCLCGHPRTLHPDDGACTVPICRNRCGGWKPKEN